MSNPDQKLGIFSFFSGIGLLDLGFHRQGFETLFVNEYHEPFIDAYRHARKRMRHKAAPYGYSSQSIEEFVGDELKALKEKVAKAREAGYLIGFIGGPPCPDFSVGGKNRGREGENGKLSQTYADLVMACQPDWFLFENVKGLWRTKRHREFFDAMKGQLGSKYALSDRLMNAVETGAPQDRDRIFLFGRHQRVFGTTQDIDWETGLSYPLRSVFDNYDWPDREPFKQDSQKARPNSLPLELTVQRWFERNNVDSHPNGTHHFQPRAGLKRFLSVDEGDDSKKSYKRLHRWRYSPTAAYGNNEVHLHPYKARRLSAAEALAIQTAPKNFELPEHMTLSNMFKSIGNAVPVLMAEHIACAIKGSLLNADPVGEQAVRKAS